MGIKNKLRDIALRANNQMAFNLQQIDYVAHMNEMFDQFLEHELLKRAASKRNPKDAVKDVVVKVRSVLGNVCERVPPCRKIKNRRGHRRHDDGGREKADGGGGDDDEAVVDATLFKEEVEYTKQLLNEFIQTVSRTTSSSGSTTSLKSKKTQQTKLPPLKERFQEFLSHHQQTKRRPIIQDEETDSSENSNAKMIQSHLKDLVSKFLDSDEVADVVADLQEQQQQEDQVEAKAEADDSSSSPNKKTDPQPSTSSSEKETEKKEKKNLLSSSSERKRHHQDPADDNVKSPSPSPAFLGRNRGAPTQVESVKVSSPLSPSQTLLEKNAVLSSSSNTTAAEQWTPSIYEWAWFVVFFIVVGRGLFLRMKTNSNSSKQRKLEQEQQKEKKNARTTYASASFSSIYANTVPDGLPLNKNGETPIKTKTRIFASSSQEEEEEDISSVGSADNNDADDEDVGTLPNSKISGISRETTSWTSTASKTLGDVQDDMAASSRRIEKDVVPDIVDDDDENNMTKTASPLKKVESTTSLDLEDLMDGLDDGDDVVAGCKDDDGCKKEQVKRKPAAHVSRPVFVGDIWECPKHDDGPVSPTQSVEERESSSPPPPSSSPLPSQKYPLSPARIRKREIENFARQIPKSPIPNESLPLLKKVKEADADHVVDDFHTGAGQWKGTVSLQFNDDMSCQSELTTSVDGGSAVDKETDDDNVDEEKIIYDRLRSSIGKRRESLLKFGMSFGKLLFEAEEEMNKLEDEADPEDEYEVEPNKYRASDASVQLNVSLEELLAEGGREDFTASDLSASKPSLASFQSFGMSVRKLINDTEETLGNFDVEEGGASSAVSETTQTVESTKEFPSREGDSISESGPEKKNVDALRRESMLGFGMSFAKLLRESESIMDVVPEEEDPEADCENEFKPRIVPQQSTQDVTRKFNDSLQQLSSDDFGQSFARLLRESECMMDALPDEEDPEEEYEEPRRSSHQRRRSSIALGQVLNSLLEELSPEEKQGVGDDGDHVEAEADDSLMPLASEKQQPPIRTGLRKESSIRFESSLEKLLDETEEGVFGRSSRTFAMTS